MCVVCVDLRAGVEKCSCGDADAGHIGLQLLLDWIHSEVDPGDTGYELWFGFPSQRLWVLEADNVATHFGAPELKQTLAEAGIQPREIVELRNLD